MDKLSSLIPRVLSKRGLKDEANASYAVFLANEWIEEHLPNAGSRVRACAFEGGILTIEADPQVTVEELKDHLNGFEGISVGEIRILKQKSAPN